MPNGYEFRQVACCHLDPAWGNIAHRFRK